MQMKNEILKPILIIFLMITTLSTVSAQWYDPLKVNTKATDIYLQGITKAQNSDYTTAIHLIESALGIEPRFVDAHLSLAGVYANLKNYAASVDHFKKALSLDCLQ